VERYLPAEPRAPAAPANDEVTLIRVGFAEEVSYLKGPHREALTDYLASAEQISRDDARQRVDGLIAGFELFQRVELVQRSDAGRATLALRVKTAQALKK
jgi:hypothetical protein